MLNHTKYSHSKTIAPIRTPSTENITQSFSQQTNNEFLQIINQTEHDFALRKFDEALENANKILVNFITDANISSYCDSSKSKYECEHDDDDATQSILYHMQMYLQSPSLLYTHQFLPSSNFTHDENKNSQSSSSLLLQSSPLSFTLKINPTRHHQQRINHPSIQERAAAIALQCAYELWRRRCYRNNHQKQNFIDGVIDDELKEHLQPFLQIYAHTHNSNDIDTSSSSSALADRDELSTFSFHNHNIISLDLMLLWIRFIYTIGLYNTCIGLIFDLLHVFLSSMCVCTSTSHEYNDDNEIFENDENENDFLYSNCNDCFNILLVEIAPRIRNKRIVESITDEIFTMFVSPSQATKQNRTCTNTKDHDLELRQPNLNKEQQQRSRQRQKSCSIHDYHPLELESNPIPSSIKILRRNIEAIIHCQEGSIIPLIMKESMEDCLEEVCQLEDLLKNESGNNNNNLNDINNTTENIKKINNRNYEFLDEDIDSYDNKSSDDKNILGGVKDNLIHHLWTSEERWLNRGKLLATGLVTYSLWRRRRGAFHVSRKAGGALLSPIQEIVSAIMNPK